ncbi:MAG TPA: type I glutamate--ammonia ligase [Acidobacteriota bacterium]|nr:type I glutamate--ammonia ligase [Acidobacteriota bacterium]
MTTIKEIQQLCEKEGVRFIDLKSLDLPGRLHHLTLPVDQFNESVLAEGVGFDGSSYGFAKTENSDMVLIPDASTASFDPFRESTTLSMFCGIHLADEHRTRFHQDVRYIAQKAESLLSSLGIADESMWAPEFEFNLFEEVQYRVTPEESSFAVYSAEFSAGNAYHACNPQDQFVDFRDRVTELLKGQGIGVRYHHHEVGGYGQQEIEMTFASLMKTCDDAILTRYLMRNQAIADGLAITFMPKPVYGQAGNGWHVHQYLVRNGVNVFYQPGEYANISKVARHYIGGILSHGKALCAITNPSTNSFKRLVPGYEAPTALTYGKANRAGAMRIPAYVSDPAQVRVEYRPPDATSNPYLCLASVLLAGIDGIVNKIDPVKAGFGPFDSIDVEKGREIKRLPDNLTSALNALEEDHEFLLRDSVFDEELVGRWIKLKREEVKQYLQRPHPYEYEQYFEF